MADSNRLAEVCALLAERDDEFRPLEQAAIGQDRDTGEPFWPLSYLVRVLALEGSKKTKRAVADAKVAAGKAGMSLSEHFCDGTLFDDDNEDVYLSKYAAYLFVVNCDPSEGNVGLAQVYFALQVDRQQLEDEKRLRTRLDVATENHKLTGVAKEKGVRDFQKFNGMGVSALYGGLNVEQIKRRKRLPPKVNHLDFAGSEELAANLFRITQTRAALLRQGHRSEHRACHTHQAVGERVRAVILEAGNTPPEELPPAELKIDQLATRLKQKLAAT